MYDIYYKKYKDDQYLPVLFSNRKKIGNNLFDYECDINDSEKIVYQLKGINIVPNKDIIPWVYWECDGFFKRATITQNGLLTIQKKSTITSDYTGTVKVRNDFGVYEIFLCFLNNMTEKLPIILSWNDYSIDNNENIYNSYSYYPVKGKNEHTNELEGIETFYFEVDDGSKVKCDNIAQVDTHIPMNGTLSINKYIKFKNLYNFESDLYEGEDLLLNNHSYKFAITESKKSYFIISGAHNFNNNEDFRHFTYKIHYDENDYDEIVQKFIIEEDLPYIEIYNKVIKNNIIYNTSETIKKYIGCMLSSKPLIDDNITGKETIIVNNKVYEYVYIADTTIIQPKYIIKGSNIDVNENIEYVNWYIEGFPEEVNATVNKNSNDEWELSFTKIENIYDYYGAITVRTNFGESSINVYFYIQESLPPRLNNNIIYDDESGQEMYKVTSNSSSAITYKLTGDNIKVNSKNHISYVTWSCEGFNNNGTIDNNGLLTITKVDNTINDYNGSVTCTNNFGSNTVYLRFYNPFDEIYPIKLSFDETSGIFITEKDLIMEVNDQTNNSSKSNILPYYIELDNGNNNGKIDLEGLNGLLPDVQAATNSYNTECKIWIIWNNILESTTNEYSGEVCLDTVTDLYFRPTNQFDTATSNNDSYFKISYNNNCNSLSYQFYYNKKDLLYINEHYKNKSSLPYIIIYNAISKCGYFYNNSDQLKLNFGFMINMAPQLQKYNTIKKINGIDYDYILYDDKTEEIEYIINGTYINYDDNNIINDIQWQVSGFNDLPYTIYKNDLEQWIFKINHNGEIYKYKGTITINTNMGTSSLNLFLEVKKGLMPILNPNIEYIDEEETITTRTFDINDNSKITYQVTGENINVDPELYIEWIRWSCEGFTNSAMINNQGLLTINKIDGINEYTGTVICENNFGIGTVNIEFNNPFDTIYPVKLSFDENVGVFTTESTLTKDITNLTESGTITDVIDYYIEIDDQNSNSKLNSIQDINNTLPEVEGTGSTIVNTYIKWENIEEIYYTGETSGEYQLKNNGAIYRFPLTNSLNSYFEIYRYDFNSITINTIYNKNDFNELVEKLNNENIINPYIYFYNKIYKNGYYYNTSTMLKLNINLRVHEPPQLYITGLTKKSIIE